MSWLNTLNYTLAVGGILLLVVTVALFVDYFLYQSKYYNRWVSQFSWPIIMATTVGSVLLSLLYSEYFGFVPCSLCWLQRIAIYPQALLSIVAFRLKEKVFFPLYGIWLSVFGFGVAIYQYIYQLVPKEVLSNGAIPCLADGSADCGAKIIDVFGFVTFPLLSAITLAFLIIMYLNLRRSQNQS